MHLPEETQAVIWGPDFMHPGSAVTGTSGGVEDILVKPQADRRRRKIMKDCTRRGRKAIKAAFNLPETSSCEQALGKWQDAHLCRDQKNFNVVDLRFKEEVNHHSNEINKVCIKNGIQC
ncbi:UNVERIFIED_CONTAM: hypothetical protein K2H54_008324 [Gekko kuhli]